MQRQKDSRVNSKRQCDLFGHTASYINTSLWGLRKWTWFLFYKQVSSVFSALLNASFLGLSINVIAMICQSREMTEAEFSAENSARSCGWFYFF
jgi:hypothetical protein